MLESRNTTDTPGLHVNPQWRAGTPGTFAVFIGVSAYPFLHGGTQFHVGDEAFTLGQLHVSALTARTFFDWFELRYDYPGAPPAQCWLLLSPNDPELRALTAQGVENQSAPATLANCELALQSWYETMARLPASAAEKSRSLFFFSGHGLEVDQDQQILLPTDYLRPPGRAVNDAISTWNLLKGLASCRVPHHFLFSDACRNDIDRLKEYDVRGRQILNVQNSSGTNPDNLAGMLYASAAGTQTWQPSEIKEGMSLFGTAVVEGLEGASGLKREGCNDGQCEVHFPPLVTFVKSRMAQLLEEFSSPEKARVRQGGSPPDGGITYVPEGGSPPTRPLRSGPRDPHSDYAYVRPQPTSRVSPTPETASPPTPSPLLTARFDVVHTDLTLTPSLDYDTAHDLLGSERMTDIWAKSARLFDLGTGEERSRDTIQIREVRRSSDTRAFRLAVELPPSGQGHWLTFQDPLGRYFAASLAGSPTGERVVYELSFDLEKGDQGIDSSSRFVSTFEAYLSPLSGGFLGETTRVWSVYEEENVAAAARELDVNDLRTIVMGKNDFPLAATIAAVLLLRSRRLDLLPVSWLDNLSEWFPQSPDGPVLRTEWDRLNTNVSEPVGAAKRLTELRKRGLPRMAEMLPAAARQVAELMQRPEVLSNPSAALGALHNQLLQAMRHYRPGGLFAVFSSQTDPLDIGLVGPGDPLLYRSR